MNPVRDNQTMFNRNYKETIINSQESFRRPSYVPLEITKFITANLSNYNKKSLINSLKRPVTVAKGNLSLTGLSLTG